MIVCSEILKSLINDGREVINDGRIILVVSASMITLHYNFTRASWCGHCLELFFRYSANRDFLQRQFQGRKDFLFRGWLRTTVGETPVFGR